jgi:hypothetical protein
MNDRDLNLKGGASRRRGAASKLGAQLEESLSAYAAAAAAAGVSLLALVSPAGAKIVYTPADTQILRNGGPLPIDLNHDGVADFFLSLAAGSSTGAFQVGASNQSNKIWGKGTISWSFRPAGPLKSVRSGAFASALRPGFKVGPSKSYFQKGGGLMGAFWSAWRRSSSGTVGQWWYTHNRYLGLQFVVNGETHYGWARVDTKNNLILKGYAYETVANKPIVTGKTKGPDVVVFEPASLGRLAQGASGISAWRK